jgi:hypothetical protein
VHLRWRRPSHAEGCVHNVGIHPKRRFRRRNDTFKIVFDINGGSVASFAVPNKQHSEQLPVRSIAYSSQIDLA